MLQNQDFKYYKKYLKYKNKYLKLKGGTLVEILSNWTKHDFISKLTLKELDIIYNSVGNHIMKITKDKVREENKFNVWKERLSWTEMAMNNQFSLTEYEENYYKNTIVCTIRGYQLPFHIIWGCVDDNYRLYELITCCREIFRHLCELKNNSKEKYDVLRNYNCNDLRNLIKHINNPALSDLTPGVLDFLKKKTTLVGSMAPNIKICLAKYIKFIMIYCHKIESNESEEVIY